MAGGPVFGLASPPGMMTGQIQEDSPPFEAVKVWIPSRLFISAGNGFSAITDVWAGSRRLFDHRRPLRLDRLKISSQGWTQRLDIKKYTPYFSELTT
jgi:hypothetical protein